MQLSIVPILRASNVYTHPQPPCHFIYPSSSGPSLQTGNTPWAPTTQLPRRPTQSENAHPCPPPASHSAHPSPSRCASDPAATAAHPDTRASSYAAAYQSAARRRPYAQTGPTRAPSRRAATKMRLTPRRRKCCLRVRRGASQSVRPSRRCGRSWAVGRGMCLVAWRGLRVRVRRRRRRSCGRSRDARGGGMRTMRRVDGVCPCRRRRGERGWRG